MNIDFQIAWLVDILFNGTLARATNDHEKAYEHSCIRIYFRSIKFS